jgi:hypothetical protein
VTSHIISNNLIVIVFVISALQNNVLFVAGIAGVISQRLQLQAQATLASLG